MKLIEETTDMEVADFEVGDEVVRINENYSLLSVGDHAVVVNIALFYEIVVTNDKVKGKTSSGSLTVLKENMRKITPLEKAMK